MRRVFVAAVLAAGLALAVPVWAQVQGTPGNVSAEPANPPPDIGATTPRLISRGITILPDNHVRFVPNIGFIEGSDAVLVVDAGLGLRNGQKVLETARGIARGRKIILVTTHFHPEHSFGASAFKGSAQIIMSTAQADELKEKGDAYLARFRSFGPDVEKALEGATLVVPDETFSEPVKVLDLGDRKVELRSMPAHTRGDLIVYVPDEGVVFGGDLIEEGFFPILPDADSKGRQWIEVLKSIERLKAYIVVPGHGLAGNRSRISAVRIYLEAVQQRVGELVRQGLSQEEITKQLAPALRALHPTWKNESFIPQEIAVFYAEAVGGR